MAAYSLLIKSSAVRELEAVPMKERRLIVADVRLLSREPRPAACEKLSGTDKFRLRRGHYRIVYRVDDRARTVLVVKIGHRKDVHR